MLGPSHDSPGPTLSTALGPIRVSPKPGRQSMSGPGGILGSGRPRARLLASLVWQSWGLAR